MARLHDAVRDLFSVEEGGQIVHRFHAHRNAGFLGRAAQMRQQHHILQLRQGFGNLGLLGKNIEARAGDKPVMR